MLPRRTRCRKEVGIDTVPEAKPSGRALLSFIHHVLSEAFGNNALPRFPPSGRARLLFCTRLLGRHVSNEIWWGDR